MFYIRGFILLALLSGGLVACAKHAEDQAASKHQGAAAIGHAECAACGMVVAEQPSPRGQIVYRDGSRAYFCSIGDMQQYLAAPHKLGAPTETYLERVEPNMDPAVNSTTERPWLPAQSMTLLVGVPRKGVMSTPVLTYEHAKDAKASHAKHGGEIMDWATYLKIER